MHRVSHTKFALLLGVSMISLMAAGGAEAAQDCVETSPGSGQFVCSGPSTGNDAPLAVTSTTPVTVTVGSGFTIKTTTSDAIWINGPGSFTDDATSSITGADSGLRLGAPAADGAYSATISGAVTGNGFYGIYFAGSNAGHTAPESLTVNAGATVVGQSGAVRMLSGGAGDMTVISNGALSNRSDGSVLLVSKSNTAANSGQISVTVGGTVTDTTATLQSPSNFGVSIDNQSQDVTFDLTQTGVVTAHQGVIATATGGVTATIDGTITSDASRHALYVAGNGALDVHVSATGHLFGNVEVNVPTGEIDGQTRSFSNAGTINGFVDFNIAAGTFTNTGIISGENNEAHPEAIHVSGNSHLMLQDGAVTGRVMAEEGSTIDWTGGTLNGSIAVGGQGTYATGTLGNLVVTSFDPFTTINVTGISAAQLATVTSIAGNAGFDTLNLSGITYFGGDFGNGHDDATRGVNIYGFAALNLKNGTDWTLTSDLATVDAVSIDATSALHVGNGVNPTIGYFPRNPTFSNAGLFDLTNGGVFGNHVTLASNYAQAATGTLAIGVSPTQIDLVTVRGNATLDGTVRFAWAPGTYTAGSRSFLSSNALSGNFSGFTSAAGTSAPTGMDVSLNYTATDAQLVLASASVVTPPPPPPPPPPVVVAPADARIFSTQTFAFGLANEQDAIALLGRSEADGGGHTSYNLSPDAGPGQRAWIEATTSGLQAKPGEGPLPFRTFSYRVRGGTDASVGSTGRIGIAVGYQNQLLRDDAGSQGRTEAVDLSVYASVSAGPVGLSAVGSYVHAWMDTDRETGVGQAHARRHVTQWLGGVQAAAPFKVSGATITPIAGVIVSRLSADGFSEDGAVLDTFRVTGSDSRRTSVSPFVQIGWSEATKRADGTVLIPDLQIGYRQASSAGGAPVTLTANDGTAFSDNRTGLRQGSWYTSASYTIHKGRWTGYATYRGQFGDGWQDNTGTVGVRVAF